MVRQRVVRLLARRAALLAVLVGEVRLAGPDRLAGADGLAGEDRRAGGRRLVAGLDGSAVGPAGGRGLGHGPRGERVVEGHEVQDRGLGVRRRRGRGDRGQRAGLVGRGGRDPGEGARLQLGGTTALGPGLRGLPRHHGKLAGQGSAHGDAVREVGSGGDGAAPAGLGCRGWCGVVARHRERGHVDEAAAVGALHDAEAQDRDRRAGLAEEVERVLDARCGARADDDEPGAGRARGRLGAREGDVVVERRDVLLEPRGAAGVAGGELGAREAPGPAGVVERRGEGLLRELRGDLDDDRETGGVEREEVGLVVGRALRDGEDLLAQQPLDVAVHDPLRVRPEGTRRLGRLDQYGTLGVHLEEGHRGFSCCSGTRPGRGRLRHSLRRRSSPSNRSNHPRATPQVRRARSPPTRRRGAPRPARPSP